MRSGAWISASWLLLAACSSLFGACSGGYSLPPTRCDEWCDATKGGRCKDDYDPAECVSSCEAANIPAEECAAEFDAVLACYRADADAVVERCYFVPGAACTTESSALGGCAETRPRGQR